MPWPRAGERIKEYVPHWLHWRGATSKEGVVPSCSFFDRPQHAAHRFKIRFLHRMSCQLECGMGACLMGEYTSPRASHVFVAGEFCIVHKLAARLEISSQSQKLHLSITHCLWGRAPAIKMTQLSMPANTHGPAGSVQLASGSHTCSSGAPTQTMLSAHGAGTQCHCAARQEAISNAVQRGTGNG